MRISIGGDHAGYVLKERLIEHLRALGHTVLDAGTYTPERTDYPDHAHAVANAVSGHEVDSGILICGSGNGVNMVANKHPGVRAALAWNEETATLARSHNNANILSLPARFVGVDEALRIADRFLATSFEGGRHEQRVNKIERST